MANETRGFRRAIAGIGVGSLVAGIGAVTYAVKEGSDELVENQKLAAQQGAVLKSTGGIANVTARELDRMTAALHKKTGVDDAAIARGQNMLLTFTNIRNEVGKGPKIFDRATRTLVDMSVALDQDASKGAIQLGKALNDPVRGVTALTKVGVTFTEGQRKTIKSLVETGQTAKAQTIILNELNREFGGSAEAYGKTFPAKIARTKEAFAGVAAEIVEALLPAAEQGVEELERMIDRLEAWANSDEGRAQLRELASTTREVASAAKSTGEVMLSVAGFLVEHRDAVVTTTVAVGSMWAAYRGYTILNAVSGAIKATTAVQTLQTAASVRATAIARTQQSVLAGQTATTLASSAAMQLAGNSATVLGANMTRTAAASGAARGAITVAGTTAAATGGRMAAAARGVGTLFTAVTGLSGPVGLAIGAVGLLSVGVYKLHQRSKEEAERARAAAAAWRNYTSAVDSAAAARDRINRAKLDVSEASVALERAEINLKRVRADSNSTALDIREAENNVARARLQHRDATKAQADQEKAANRERLEGIRVAQAAAGTLNALAAAQAEETRLLAARKNAVGSFDRDLLTRQLADNRKRIDALKMQESEAVDALDAIRRKGYADYVKIGDQYVVQTRRNGEIIAGVSKNGFRKVVRNANTETGKLPGVVRGHVEGANREVGKLGDVKLDREKIIADLTEPFRNLGSVISSAIGTVKVSVSALLKFAGIGGAGDGGMVGALSGVDAFTPLANRAGLVVSSGYRPGDDGYHGVNRARDYAGPSSAMRGFATMVGTIFGKNVKELIYSPLGWGIKNGHRVNIRDFYGPAVYNDHFDHVHVAMQRGGIVPGTGMGDRIPAMLEAGEVVVNRNAVARMGGPTAFHAATNLAVPRYAVGGGPSVDARLAAVMAAAAQRYAVNSSTALSLQSVQAQLAAVANEDLSIPGQIQRQFDAIAASRQAEIATNSRLLEVRGVQSRNKEAVDSLNDRIATARKNGASASSINALIRTRDDRLRTLRAANEEERSLTARSAQLRSEIEQRVQTVEQLRQRDKELDDAQASLGDQVVSLTAQLGQEAQAARAAAAESALRMFDAEADIRAAIAEGTTGLEDDLASNRERLELATARRRIIEEQLAAGNLTDEARLDLLGQQAAAIRSQNQLQQAITQVENEITGTTTGTTGGTSAPTGADLRALIDAFRQATREASNVRAPITVQLTQPIVGAQQFLDTVQHVYANELDAIPGGA